MFLDFQEMLSVFMSDKSVAYPMFLWGRKYTYIFLVDPLSKNLAK